VAVLVNVYATCRQIAPPSFEHTMLERRDRSDPELIEHLDGFIGYIMQGGQRPMTQSLYHVMRHIQRVRQHLSLRVDRAHFEALADWAWSINAIIFLEDGSVRDPAGRMLVAADTGLPADGAHVPYPRDAIDRKQRHDERLRADGIAVADGLPPEVGEHEVVLRTPREVAERAFALLAVALRGESIDGGDALSASDLRKRLPFALDALSPKEAAFMSDAAPSNQAAVDHAWRYECVWTLQWALGLVEPLGSASMLCDVPRAASLFVDAADQGALVESATLRPTAEILDALDLHLRLHWATRDATQHGRPPPADLEPGVLQERRVALNWLTRFEDAPWDNVDAPT